MRRRYSNSRSNHQPEDTSPQALLVMIDAQEALARQRQRFQRMSSYDASECATPLYAALGLSKPPYEIIKDAITTTIKNEERR